VPVHESALLSAIWRVADDACVHVEGRRCADEPAGPVQATRAGRAVPMGGPKQRAVLALLLEEGRAVPAEYLAEAVA
jgi:hypothetical protein